MRLSLTLLNVFRDSRCSTASVDQTWDKKTLLGIWQTRKGCVCPSDSAGTGQVCGDREESEIVCSRGEFVCSRGKRFVCSRKWFAGFMGIRAELRVKNFGLDHDQPRKFVTSQWGHATFYVLWRVFWAIFHSVWVVTSFWMTSEVTRSSTDLAKWFIYLSNWTYLTLTVETCIEAVVLIWTLMKRKDITSGTTKYMPWYFKVQWMLYTIVTSGSFHISAFYWLIIFKEQTITPVRVAIHGINSIYVFLNILVTATPLRLLHFVYPIAFGTAYTMFTVLYFVADGTNLAGERYIYRLLKWDHLKSTIPIVCISTFVVLPLEHCFVFLLYRLRLFCHRYYNNKQRNEMEKEKNVEAIMINSQSQISEKDADDVTFDRS